MNYFRFSYMRLLLLLLLVSVATITSAQDTSSWINAFNSSSGASEKAIASQKLGRYFSDSASPERGLVWAEKGLPFAERSDRDSLLWQQYDLIADLYDKTLHFDRSIEYMLKSLSLKKKNNDLKRIAGTYNDLGVVHGEKTELVQQADYYIKAKKIYDQIGDTLEADLVAINLAGVYLHQGFYEKALKAFHELIPRFKRNDYVSWLYLVYLRMAMCFAATEQHDSVFYYSNLEIDAAFNGWEYELNSFDAWARRVYYCHQFKDYKNYKQAVDSMMHYAGIAKGDINWGNYYKGLARYHLTITKEYDSALHFLNKANENARAHGDKQEVLDVYDAMAEAYERKNDFLNAYKSLRHAFTLKDSIVTSDGRQQFAEMLTKYETEKKETQILLLDKENKLKQRTTYFLIGGLVLLCIVLFNLFRNNQIKQKNNAKLQTLNNALDEANQSKVRLFSILSHDLRSPVSSLYGYLQLKKIAPQMLTDEKRELKEDQLYQSAGHLLNTMEDLLIWSKSQLESFVPEKTETAVLPLVQDVLNVYESTILSKNIRIELPDEDMSVFTDGNMLQTIIRNLIANAVSYTLQNGTIRVIFDKHANSLSFFNVGKPIKPSVADRLFDWSHIDSHSSGYGLKLSKALADKLNIDMSVAFRDGGNWFALRINN